jgi:DNA-binding MarR family transcriptional regulator
MKIKSTLSHELANLALILMEILKQECKSASGTTAPTLTQFKMLYIIKGGVRHVGKLAEALNISQPAASKMVEIMVLDGLLKRIPHPHDRRQIELHLTAKASANINAIYQRAFKTIEDQLSSLSTAKKKHLAARIQEISCLLRHTQRNYR